VKPLPYLASLLALAAVLCGCAGGATPPEAFSGPAEPAVMEPETPLVGPNIATPPEAGPLSGLAVADLAGRLGVQEGAIEVLSIEAVRLGLAMVARLGEAGGQSVVEARRFGSFRSLADFCRRTKLGRRAVEALIWAGAFDGWGVPRRQLLWDLKAALEAAENPPGPAMPVSKECPRFGFFCQFSPRGGCGRRWPTRGSRREST